MKCSHCRMIAGQCMCYRIPQSDIGCEILILRHFKEAKRSTNSAGLAAIALDRCQIRDVMGSRLNQYETRDGDALLFPVGPNAPMYQESNPPRRLIVIDGSWRQARKIVRKTKGLYGLPRVAIAPIEPEPIRIRKPPFIGGMSTFESLIAAQVAFGGDHNPLLQVWSEWVNQIRINTGIPDMQGNTNFRDARINSDLFS